MLFVAAGKLWPARDDSRICAVAFVSDGRSTDGVHCSRVDGVPMMSHGGWLVTSVALAAFGLDESLAGPTIAFPQPAIRDDGVPPLSVVALDVRGETAVVSTPDAAVVWPLTDEVFDGRRASGPGRTAPPSRVDGAPPPAGSRCGRTLLSDPADSILAVSADGRWAVVRRGARVRQYPSLSSYELWSCTDAPQRVAVLCDGDLALTQFDASAQRLLIAPGGVPQLWARIGDAWRLTGLRFDGRVTAAALSPDGRWLALGRLVPRDYGVSLVSLSASGDPDAPQDLAGPGFRNPPTAIAFRPDSRQLAMLTMAAGETGPAALAVWESDAFHTGGEPSLVVDGVDPRAEAGIRYQGDWLWLIGEDGIGRTAWPITASAVRAQAERNAGRNLSPVEWRAGFGDRPYQATFAGVGEHPERIAELVDGARAALGDHRVLEGVAGYQTAVARALDRDDPASLQRVC
ncbi:MAG TPA: hypothetical protein VF484_06330, partial [Candidatus Limnocylindrales bacterium]